MPSSEETLTAAELAEQVAQNAINPQSTTTDGLSYSMPSLKDQRETVDWAAKKAAARSGKSPIQFSKVVSKGLL